LGLAKDEAWAPHIIEPIKFLRLDDFAESAIIIKSVGKVEPSKQWDVAGEFRRRIKLAFEKNGIEIPLPQRVIINKQSQK
ncbi:MAG: mechanosensitive ion channel family protein, partial [Candidatus Saccharimonadales bacterium]